MRRPDRHNHVVSSLRIYILGIFIAGGREADCAFGDEEGLVVHFVPVGWRTGHAGGDDEFGGAEAVLLC